MFQFKGDRHYLHGTDFYQHTQQLLSDTLVDYDFIKSIAFRNFTERQCRLSFIAPNDTDVVPCSGKAVLETGKLQPFWWIETDEAVLEHYPYAEQQVIDGCQIVDRSIQLAHPNVQHYSVIETIVALTKHLHYDIDPDVDGKWVFGQLNLVQPLPLTSKSVQIGIKNWIPKRFSVSDIQLDGQRLGTIRFIVG